MQKIDKLTVATKAVFLTPQGEVLMLREAETNPDGTNVGLLNIPGGRIEWGESVKEGFQRETLEETGIDITGMKAELFETSEWRPNIRGQQWQIIALFFLIRVEEKPDVKLSIEHDAFEWVPIEGYENNPLVIGDEKNVFETLKKCSSAF